MPGLLDDMVQNKSAGLLGDMVAPSKKKVAPPVASSSNPLMKGVSYAPAPFDMKRLLAKPAKPKSVKVAPVNPFPKGLPYAPNLSEADLQKQIDATQAGDLQRQISATGMEESQPGIAPPHEPKWNERLSVSSLKAIKDQANSLYKGGQWISAASGLNPSLITLPEAQKLKKRQHMLADPEGQAGAANLAMLGAGGAALDIAKVPTELAFGAYSAWAGKKGIKDAGGIQNYLLDHPGEAGMNALGVLAGVHGLTGVHRALLDPELPNRVQGGLDNLLGRKQQPTPGVEASATPQVPEATPTATQPIAQPEPSPTRAPITDPKVARALRAKLAAAPAPQATVPEAQPVSATVAKEPYQMGKEEFASSSPAVPGYLYHGSATGGVPETGINFGHNTQAWENGPGFYTTPSRDVAEGYAEGSTYRGQRIPGKGVPNPSVQYVKAEPKSIFHLGDKADMSLWKDVAARLDKSDPVTDGTGSWVDFVTKELRNQKTDLTNSDVYDSLHNSQFGTFGEETGGIRALETAFNEVLDVRKHDTIGYAKDTASGLPKELVLRHNSNARVVPSDEVHSQLVQQAINEGKITGHPDYPEMKPPAPSAEAPVAPASEGGVSPTEPTDKPNPERGAAIMGNPLEGEVTAAKQDIGNFAQGIKDLKAQADSFVGHGENGGIMARALDEASGKTHQFSEQMHIARKPIMQEWDKQPVDSHLEFMDRLIKNDPQPTPELQARAADYQKQLTDFYKEEQAVRPDMGYVEHYWPQSLGKAAKEYIRRRYAGETPEQIGIGKPRRGIQFAEPSFMQHREGPNWNLQIMQELIDRGLMKETNPEVLFQARAVQHMRFMNLHDALTKAADLGALQPAIGPRTPGVVPLSGDIASVLGRDKVAELVAKTIADPERYQEMVKAGRRDQLTRDIQKNWEARPGMAGNPAARAGSIKAAVTAGTIAPLPKGMSVTKWLAQASTEEDLATYARHNAIQAAHEGKWNIGGDQGMVDVLNNEFSPSISNMRLGGVAKAIRSIQSAYMRVLLAFPGFHAVSTSMSTVSSALADAAKAASQGDLKLAGKQLKGVNVLGEAIRGHKMLKEYRNTPYDQLSPQTKAYVDAGGTAGLPHELASGHWNAAKRRLAQGAPIRAAGNAALAIPEVATKAVMEEWVPSLKMAADSRKLAFRQGQLDRGQITPEQFKALRTRDFDNIENVFGEMNMDRLHIPRGSIEGLKLLFPTLTWRGGSARTLAGAVKDVAYQIRGATNKGSIPIESRELTDRQLFIASELVTTAIASTLLMKSMSGRTPKTALDLVMPQDGGKTKDGTASRMRLPMYASRDWPAIFRFAYTHDPKDLINGPSDYVFSGVGPVPKRAQDVAAAWKYSPPGDAIHNMVGAAGGDLPLELGKAAGSALTLHPKEAMQHLGKAATSGAAPIVTQMFAKTEHSPHPVATHALQAVGIGSSPQWATDTPAWKMIHKIKSDAFAGKPYLQSAKDLTDQRKTLAGKMKAGTLTEQERQDAVANGVVPETWFKAADKKKGYTPLQSAMMTIPLKQRLVIYQKMIPSEKVEFEKMYSKVSGKKRATASSLRGRSLESMYGGYR